MINLIALLFMLFSTPCPEWLDVTGGQCIADYQQETIQEVLPYDYIDYEWTGDRWLIVQTVPGMTGELVPVWVYADGREGYHSLYVGAELRAGSGAARLIISVPALYPNLNNMYLDVINK